MMRNSLKETHMSNNQNFENSGGFKNTNMNDNEPNSMMKMTSTSYDNLKVVIRVRPALPREMEMDLPFRSVVLVTNDNKSCNLVEYLGAELSERERQREWVENPNLFQLHRFTFDYVFDMDSQQQEVYEQTAKPAVISILEGYNSTIFAYGQTGTGKTYTMEGFAYNSSDSLRGIIPRCIEEIFNYIESLSSSDTKFMVRASYLQIYNEAISDLLKPEKSNLQIREDRKKGVFVEGLSEWAVRSPSDIYTLLQRGALCRATASTKMNDVSSRSHAVFVITVEQMTIVDDGKGESMTQIKVGKLNLVDLAGSERIRVTGATGKQLEESKKINKSLSALGNVIYALTDSKGRTHIPYRDSKLTRLLEDSLGGNCKTTMMAMISPSHDSFNESLSTLHFARRAKNIKNRPKINEDVDHKALIRQYEVELKKLRAELDEKTRLIHSNEVVIQLEEEKKRAEEDKQAAIFALEQASKQYLQEREEKKRLEMKISMMNSQVIVGGHKIEDTPQFRSALEERQTILLKEFDQKLQEFEKERQQIEEDKAQVERYKQLLLKQRDIMIALTNKLNERDEAIVQLQEELDAYDKINREQEEVIENKNQRVLLLENIMRRNNIRIPDDNFNQVEKEKNYTRGKLDKVYLPYEAEKNGKEYENTPITLLSSDEKIRELKNIMKEQEKEINILKIVSQKFINSTQGNKNQLQNNFQDLISKTEKDYEVHVSLNDL